MVRLLVRALRISLLGGLSQSESHHAHCGSHDENTQVSCCGEHPRLAEPAAAAPGPTNPLTLMSRFPWLSTVGGIQAGPLLQPAWLLRMGDFGIRTPHLTGWNFLGTPLSSETLPIPLAAFTYQTFIRLKVLLAFCSFLLFSVMCTSPSKSAIILSWLLLLRSTENSTHI